MKKYMVINNDEIKIPTLLWGKASDKVIIAVHGDFSNKGDTIIKLLAKNAIPKGYCVLSFDLPEHGERKACKYECNPQNCISDLLAVYSHAKSLSGEVTLFGCSIGAYFSLLAFHGKELQNSLFLSPIVNMERVIQNMMTGFQVNEPTLKCKGKISLPIGKTLDWDYYTYVKQHPINFEWDSPIQILYGSKDALSAKEEIENFSRKYNAGLTILENAEHYFCSDEQLHSFEAWLHENLCLVQ